jgi:hypothetical protein
MSTISTTRKAFGLIGALLCVSAFAVALAGTVFISVSYTQEFQARCGTPAASLRVSSFVYGLMVGGLGFGGCALASAGGFSSRWWRFFRNTTVGLCVFTFLFTLFLR